MGSPTSVESSLPEVDLQPSQPTQFQFPKCQFGKNEVVNRSFQNQWFERWRWLYYDESPDLAFATRALSSVQPQKHSPSSKQREH